MTAKKIIKQETATKVATKKPSTKKVTTVATKKEINYNSDFVPGTNCVLYHVRKPLENMTITIKDWDAPDAFASELKEMFKQKFPKVGAHKWKAISRILTDSGHVGVKHREDTISYTVAIGYNPSNKALVVSYAKANLNHEKASRSIGQERALGRLKKAIKLANEGMIVDYYDILEYSTAPWAISGTLTKYIDRSRKFFKNQPIEKILVYMSFGDSSMVLADINADLSKSE